MTSKLDNPFGDPSEHLPSLHDHTPPKKPSPDQRVHGVTIFRPIIYGNVSYRVDVPPPNQAARSTQDDNNDWFRWTVYVRGAENEDLSYFIQRVVFYLHDSYSEPVRVIDHAPFELTEEGWGQFDIKIEIYFHDIPGVDGYFPMETVQGPSSQRPVAELTGKALESKAEEKRKSLEQLIPSCFDSSQSNKISLDHPLRLFARAGTSENSRKGIVEETYSEIEFIDPYYGLLEKLMLGPHRVMKQHPFNEHWKHRVVELAEQEQVLIERISKSHQALWAEMAALQREYEQLRGKEDGAPAE